MGDTTSEQDFLEYIGKLLASDSGTTTVKVEQGYIAVRIAAGDEFTIRVEAT